MNSQTSSIITSLTITTLVSLAIGIAFYLFNQLLSSFFAGFLLAFIAQFIIFYFWQGWLINKQQLADASVLEAYANQNIKQSVQLFCAYCRSQNNVNIDVNEENVFNCLRCNQQNVVMMEFSTAQMTVPQDSDAIYKNIQQAADNITIKTKDSAEPIKFT